MAAEHLRTRSRRLRGPTGIAAAHRLFHADSYGILDPLSRTAATTAAAPAIGRRETSILLCTALLRAAGQDWHEQGDVWHRVTRMRPAPADAPAGRLHILAGQLRTLISLDTSPPPHADTPLAAAGPWLAGFTHAGRELGDAAHHGALHRGVRDVLAHHVIFHWNRLGLPTRTQGLLARAALIATLDATDRPGTEADVAAP